MFVGHYGISFVAARRAPRVPLWVWFIATQWMDVVWSVLVLAGVEKLRIVPGFTEANALDLYYMPYTHGLPGSIVVSLVFGLMVGVFVSERRAEIVLLAAAASFSHWILDFIVHTRDLPLYDDSAKVGLGLWRHVVLSFPLEIIVLGFGAWIYARRATSTPTPTKARFILWGFVAFLALVQVYANFGPPPTSPTVMAVMALGLYVVLAALAAWVEHAGAFRSVTGP